MFGQQAVGDPPDIDAGEIRVVWPGAKWGGLFDDSRLIGSGIDDAEEGTHFRHLR